MAIQPYPTHIDLESSNICNSGQCEFCPYPIMKRPKGFMSLELVRKITSELKGKRVQTSYEHMIGEGLLPEHIFEIIELVAKAGIRTSISTNGILLRKRRDEILNSRLNELTIAFDGVSKEVYEKYRKGIRFEETLYNTFDFLSEWSLRKSKIHVQIQLIIMRDNQKEIDLLRKTFSKFSSRGSLEILCKGFSTFAGRIKDFAVGTPSRRQHCQKPFRELTILWDGTAVGCCRSYEKFEILGDANIQTIHEIWCGKKYNEFREKFKRKDFNSIILCKNC